MSYQHIPFGSALNLELLLPDGNTSKYPQAHVYDSAGSEVSGSPFTLTHAVNALYRNTSFVPLTSGRFSAIFITYNDSGHTVESTKYGRARDNFEVDSRISEITAIKSQTDQLGFTGGNVNAETKVNSDKTEYSLTTAEKEDIADRVWDEARADHQTAGSFGEAAQGVISTARANNLDNLDTTVSSRESEINAATRFGTTDSKNTAIKAKTDQLQFTAGNVHADSKVVSDKTGYQTTLGDKSGVADAVWDESRGAHTVAGTFGESNQGVLSTQRANNLDNLDTTVSSRESEVDAQSRDTAVNAKLDNISGQTDKLTFSGSNVNAQTKVNEDKTGYALTFADQHLLVDKIWDEYLSGHQSVGTTGKALFDSQQSVAPESIANAVWDAALIDHYDPNTFGASVQDIREVVGDNFAELNSPIYGLNVLKNQATNNTSSIISEVNINEGKIDTILPEVVNSRTLIIAEVNQNEVKIDTLTADLIAAKADIIAEVNTNEAKIDSLTLQVGTIQNNTTSRFAVPTKLLKPDTGTKNYEFHLRLYDSQGNAEAPDSIPTIRIRRLDLGVDIVSGAAMTYLGSVGAYSYTYPIDAATPETHLLVEASVTEGGATRLVPAVTEVTEFQSDLDNIQSKLTVIDGKVTSTQSVVTNPTYGLSALKTGQTNIISEVDQNEVKIDQVKARTDLIPNSPATEASVANVTATVLTRPTISDINSSLATTEAAIRGVDNRDLTSVYNVFDVSGLLQSDDPRLNYLDVAVSSRSTLTAANVWGHATRTLSAFVLPPAEVDKIWDYATASLDTVGSIGKRLADNIDATISSRATAAQVSAELAGVAQQSTLLNVQTLVVQKNDLNAAKIDAVQVTVDGIKEDTDRIPLTPASEPTLIAEHNTTQLILANIESKVDGVKTKTDNLPSDPASQGSVIQIPTNPLLRTDIRLNNLDASISSRSTLTSVDLQPLAKTTEVTSSKDEILTRLVPIESKVDVVDGIVDAIKVKTDNLPADPASEAQATSNKDAVLTAIDNIPTSSGTTPEAVWSYATRELTSDPNLFKADVSDLATKDDVDGSVVNHYENCLSTVYNIITGAHDIIVWAEKNGEAVPATDCTVTVKTAAGSEIWTDTKASPNSDGLFSFSEITSSFQVYSNYYVVITMTVDGQARTSQKSFFTVG